MKHRLLIVFFGIMFFGHVLSSFSQSGCNGKTYKQEAWGAQISNPANTYLTANFNSAFPNGLVIGCTNKLVLNSSVAVLNFLPSGPSGSSLPSGTITNPGLSYSNLLAGQLTALILNTVFDANDPNFSPSIISLGNYTIMSGVFAGMTVNSFISIANSEIGTCTNQYNLVDLIQTAVSINTNYDSGITNNGYLACNTNTCNLVPSVVTGSILCHGASTNATVSVSGGTAPYSGVGIYSVSAGTHTYTISDANNCTVTVSFSTLQPDLLSASSTLGNILCHGGTTTISITASGGTAPYAGTGVYTVNSGAYSYAVTDANGCIGTVSGFVPEPPQLILNTFVENGTCSNANLGSATVSATGGTGGYSYLWSNSSTSTVVSGLIAGVYTVSVLDSNLCSASQAVTIASITCCNLDDGGAISGGGDHCGPFDPAVINNSVTPTGGLGSVTYTWYYNLNNVSSLSGGGWVAIPSSNSLTYDPGILTQSTYFLRTARNDGCIVEMESNIVAYLVNSIPSVTATEQSVRCFGTSTGTVDLIVNGGTQPFTYLWNTNASSPTLVDVIIGNYSVVITDANGCVGTASVTVTEPPVFLASASEGTILCNGGTTTLTIIAQGGLTPYSGDGIFNVNGGPYSFTVTDANGCASIVTGTISEPSLFSASVVEGDILCHGGTTTVNVIANGGAAPYSGAGIYTLSAGAYFFTVSDANGCSEIVSGTLFEPTNLVATETHGDILCQGGTTTINITATGGTGAYGGTGVFTVSAGPFSYTVTDGNACEAVISGNISEPLSLVASATEGNAFCGGTTTVEVSASGGTAPYTGTGIYTVSVGSYSYTVTDANGCTSSVSGTITQASGLTANSSQGIILCNGGTTTVNITATGGTSPYNGTGVFTVSAGAYSYTVSDSNGCTSSVSGTITQPFGLIANATQGSILCNGGTTTINVSATGGTGPYTGTGIFTVSAGLYSHTVTDANGCTSIVSGTITQPSGLTANSSQGTILCNGGTTTVNVTATGGTGPYTGTGIFTVSAGAYSYTVTDANGCSTNVTGTITQPTGLTANATQGSILCNGGTTTVNITATGGTAPYTGTGIYTVSAGAYSYTVTDANGCNTNVSGTISEPSSLTASSSHGNIFCGGSTTVNVTATGGTTPYTGTGIFTVSAGAYSYTVTDVNGCTSSVSGTITQPSGLSANSSQGIILCNGATTTVNITATGGTAPYTGTGIFTVSAGAYSYTATDANGCTSSVSGTITQPSGLYANSSQGTILCNGATTTVNITATGGTAPYTGTGIFTVSAGVYSYTVTDANGCTSSVSGTITQPSGLTANATQGSILCHGGTTTVNVTATGGTAPYTGTGIYTVSAGSYSYTVTDANGCTTNVSGTISEPSTLTASSSQGNIFCGGSTTVNVTATGGTAPYTGTGIFTVSAGAYSYTVTDGNGCTSSVSGTITQPSGLSANSSQGTILCNGATTTVNITATGGTAPYTGTGIFTVSAGAYSYTVTDANGCTSTVSGTITQPSGLTANSTQGIILCNGGTTTVNVTATGGTAPYTGTGIYTVSAGAYSYTVTDANGCTSSVSGTITQPSGLTANSTQGTILCNGGTTTVNITATGGTAPYTGTGTFTVSAGAYSYIVTDANGCTSSVSGTITQPSGLTANSTQGNILCNGGTTTVNVTATGGTAPYTGTGIFTVSAGAYSYTVTDANGCTSSVSGTITQPSGLTANATQGNILCNGGTTTVNVTATGGTAPYTGTGIFTVSAGTFSYTVTDANGCTTNVSGTISEPSSLSASSIHGNIFCGGTTTVNVTATGGTAPYTGTGIFTVSAGAYTYTVTDANGCASSVSGTITQPSGLFASSSQGTILCNGGTTTVNITATGGTTPYTGTGIYTVSAGAYSYTVTDANGCSTNVTGTITQPSGLTANAAQGTILCNGATTTVNITATGGTAPYTGTGIFTVSAGAYSYTVTDANECSTTVSGTISEPSSLTASSSHGNIFCGGTTTVNVTATGGTGPYTGTGIFTVSAGAYSYTVTDANGCSTNVTGTITQPSGLTANSSQGSILCYGGTTTVNVTATGGTAPYTGIGIFTVSAGAYSYTVTDANGCSTNVTGTISEPTTLTANSTHGNIFCGGTTTVNVTATGGTGPYTGTGIFTVSAGVYFYTVTDANGCTSSVSGTITQPSGLFANSSQGTILCNGATTTVNITATGGTTPYTGTGIYTVSAGAYSYTVTDANGCSTSVTGTISEPSSLSASSSHGNIFCGGTTTVNVTATGGTGPYSGTGIFTVSAGAYSYTVTDANGCTSSVSGTITQPSGLNANATQGSILCNGGTTTLNITAIGGTAPYTGTGIYTVSAGTYSYIVTDANGCTTNVTGTISEPSSLTASSSHGNIFCGGTTTVNITATGGTGPYTGTGIFTVSGGAYSYTVTDGNGCTSSVSGTITQPSGLTANSTQGNILCNGGTTTVNVTATGGTTPYTGTGIFTVSAGAYSYTVTDANGCSTTVSGTISEPSSLTASSSHGNIFCGGTTTVNITATGGTAPYTGTGIFTVSAGAYSYTLTDANGCASAVSGTITQPSGLTANSVQGSILCNGGTTTVNITATGGTAPYIGTGIYTVSAGVYSYTLTDANGCASAVSGTITQPSGLIANATQGTILCNGGTTTVNVTATGGTGPYTGTGIFTVSAGVYSYTVTDANGCTTNITGTISQPATLTASSTHGNIFCGASTTVNVTATGGTGPYTGTGIFTVGAGAYSYTITDANGCSTNVTGTITQPSGLTANATQGTILCHGGTTTVNVTASGGTAPYTGTGVYTVCAGVYTYTVTDANGCKGIVTGTVTQPPSLSASSTKGTILCHGGTTTVNVTASGGTAPYTGTGVYTVCAGAYSYTVTDANGCKGIVTGTVTQPSSLSANSTKGTILCHGGTTTVNVTASGGTAPYTGTGVYTVCAGVYSYTVTDANGCKGIVTGTVTQPSSLSASSTKGTILCHGGTTTVNVTATGGTAPYTGTGVYTVCAGVYSYTVTDANGCKGIITGTVTQPSSLSASSTKGTILCHGGTTTVNVTASGGTAPYTGTGVYTVCVGVYSYTVTDANGCKGIVTGTVTQPSSLSASSTKGTILCHGGTTTVNVTASGGTAPYTGAGVYTVCAGVYSYTVTDANGCKGIVTGTVTQPSSLSASSTKGTILCHGGTTTVNVTASGGTAPYTGTGVYTVCAGAYSYTVTDANGCKSTVTGTISQPNCLTANATSGTVICHGGTTTVNVTASGGTGPYTGTGTRTVSAGAYSYTVTDANGCTSIVTGTITEPTLLLATSTASGSACGSVVVTSGGGCEQVTTIITGNTKTVTVGASGGTAPYSGTGSFIVNAGAYSYTVTDSKGCKAITTITVVIPPSMSLSIAKGTVTCYGGSANATANVSGGLAPYSYNWNTSPVQTTSIASLPVGSRTVIVTDAQGCVKTGTVSMVLASCSGFKTITQGGWGAGCAGNNWGCYRNSNFGSAFPSGITIGAGSKILKLTSASAVENFLPSSTTARALDTGTLTDPGSSYKNVLAGQVVALTLNIGFDNYDSNFGQSSTQLSNLVVTSGTFAGWTVGSILLEANKILGGQTSSYTASQINTIVDDINNNYDNGCQNLGKLTCPCTGGNKLNDLMYTSNENEQEIDMMDNYGMVFNAFPNPFYNETTVNLRVNKSGSVTVKVYNVGGQVIETLYEGEATANKEYTFTFNGEKFSNGVYLLIFNSNEGSQVKKLILNK